MRNLAGPRRKRIVATGSVPFRDAQRESIHAHPEHGQLKWPSTGVASVRTPGGIFVAGPSHAVWIPAGLEHGGVYCGDVLERNVYVRAEASELLPTRCCLVPVGSRLAERIASAVAEESHYGRRSRAEDLAILRLMEETVVDSGRRPLDLVLPESSRIQAVLDQLLVRPQDPRGIAAWADEAGMAERSLLRAFHSDTGLSFREWKKRARVHRALHKLSIGTEVGQVAEELGYDSTSAFIFRFRATLGTTPARYFQPPR